MDGFTLKILFLRIREGLPDAALFLVFVQWLDCLALGADLGLRDHALRLLSELPRHLLMPLLHFFVGDVQLVIPGTVRRDLRGARPVTVGAPSTVNGEALLVALNLLMVMEPVVAFEGTVASGSAAHRQRIGRGRGERS